MACTVRDIRTGPGSGILGGADAPFDPQNRAFPGRVTTPLLNRPGGTLQDTTEAAGPRPCAVGGSGLFLIQVPHAGAGAVGRVFVSGVGAIQRIAIRLGGLGQTVMVDSAASASSGGR